LTGLPRAARRAACAALGLAAFVLSLELLKHGALSIAPWLRALHVAGLAGGVGFGWLAACLLLSGSPVAAIALSLLAAGALRREEAFAMIVGSRLGASFVVLLVGIVDDLRCGRTRQRSAYVGVAALAATAAVYLPAMALGYYGLESGWLSGLRQSGRELLAPLGWASAAASRLATGMPLAALFALGVLGVLGSFRLFDGALPDLARGPGPLNRAGEVLYRPWFMFLIGLGVTALTLSVSVSLSPLVPLAARGYVRRENIFPYILGANITTFLDTLVAGAVVGHPEAVRMVVLLMGAVSVLSLPLVTVFSHAFERRLDGLARAVTASGSRLAVFTAAVLLAPLLLLAFSAVP
jgi:solute carrier family 34 (sodium-dependent phosphate cotransporter)